MDELLLADWRREIARLYTDVRALAVADPAAAHQLWRGVREQLYREHPQSPVPAAERPTFRARHFAYDAAWRYEVELRPEPAAAAPSLSPIALPNSGSDTLSFRRVGAVEVPFAAGRRTLSVFWMVGYAGGIFLPFRDATNGGATYPAGRYLLDSAKSADLGGDSDAGTLTLDFNFAYQPSCAFDPRWACPLAPPENRLDLAVSVGERIA